MLTMNRVVAIATLLLIATLSAIHAWTTTDHRHSPMRAPIRLFVQEPKITTNSIVECDDDVDSTRRRQLALLMSTSLIFTPQTAFAGEVGTRITKAVTQSDLGVSVRKSVVRGAQIFDQIDGQWEKFSDEFGLGAARSQQPGRPKPKVIPDPLPLDKAAARQILDTADNAFTTLTGVALGDLAKRISKLEGLVKPSFVRSGLVLSENGNVSTGDQFNFASYVHFKAYGDYMVESKKPFAPFYQTFTKQLGQELLSLLLSPQQLQSLEQSNEGSSKEASLQDSLKLVDKLCASLVSKGLVASTDRSEMDKDGLMDWVEGDEDYQFSVALDGDVTRGAQTLLQEQGFRLYPNYGRFAVASMLSQLLPTQKVTVDEYYMDTDYNSDPSLYEVKEVLLNVVVENP